MINGYNLVAHYFNSSRARQWPEIENQIKKLKPNASVLDLGSGSGRLLLSLPKNCRYLGIDFSGELVSIARAKYPDRDFLVADFTDQSVYKNLPKYDAIFAVASFHHIVEHKDRSRVFKLAYDHLKKDGLLVVSVWNLWNKKHWSNHLLSLLNKVRFGTKTVMVPFQNNFLRFHWAFTPQELKSIAVRSGFSDTNISVDYYTNGQKDKWHKAHNILLVAKK